MERVVRSRLVALKQSGCCADQKLVFSICRYCGAELERPQAPLEICAACEGSPLCDSCGHPRADHGQVFIRDVPAGCHRIVGDFQSLTSWQCDCEGFKPVAGRLAEAAFAQADPDPLTLPLRKAAR